MSRRNGVYFHRNGWEAPTFGARDRGRYPQQPPWRNRNWTSNYRPFRSTYMAGETSWVRRYDNPTRRETGESDPISELGEEGDKEGTVVCIDERLPDDLLRVILAFLPVESIAKARCVSKKWHGILISKTFLWNLSRIPPQKPWYFMFTSSDEPIGYAYDPILRKWHSIELPFIGTSNWFIASSGGMVSFMDNDSMSNLCVCNPITKTCRKLKEPPGLTFPDYSALAMSVNRESQSYTVAIVKSKQVPENFVQWDISIHIYDSEQVKWMTSITEVLSGWRSGDESVICNGVLYFLVYATRGIQTENRHALIAYNLSNGSSQIHLARNFIQVPCSLTCGRLMDMKGKLVMVGGIGKPDRSDIIKGIGIWILNDRKWEEIGRMPHKFFQGFGELDDVFSSRGAEDMIYIQSYGAPALLIFDMNSRHWKWAQKCPVSKRFPLQLFSGFCFEPRLEMTPWFSQI
ncbi:PREDICTED: F-box/kelch-repeat protein At3g61590-like isoform X2 [Lupinus angustifolius]|uniref:F-box/kelch-repeat protein At3g61590-like isoform X2 n=1 Tax=Lupinus angustifolius TaxID=3871 RepID=UPI00092EA14D|nr:PREDICTED: F-box/kelch-repeat protein At3g61590-like isoform X2 [Lupinus angustifolius]